MRCCARLPAIEAGSSIMLGLVNPPQVEALTLVCAQVSGHAVAVGIAASQGRFEPMCGDAGAALTRLAGSAFGDGWPQAGAQGVGSCGGRP